MSQAGNIGSGGGGGGITSVVGQDSLVAPTTTVTTAAGVATVENRAWESQYVVDPSNTQGLRGTFDTIQSALTQAQSDGMSITSPRKIIIRPGTYIEDLSIPDGAFFYSGALPDDPTQVPAFVSIQGNHSVGFFFSSSGIQWDNITSSYTFTGFGTCVMLADNSIFSCTSGGGVLDNNAGFTQLYWNNCKVNATAFSLCFNLGSFNGGWITNCRFNNAAFQLGGSVALRIENCPDVGPFTLLSGASVYAINCNFYADVSSCISGDGSCYLINCGFQNNDSTFPAINVTGLCQSVGSFIQPGAPLTAELFAPGNPISFPFLQLGNVLKGSRFAIDVTAPDTFQANYIGIIDTSAPRTVVLNSASPADYQIYVVDESGLAGTNNITVSASSGNINGAVNYSINTNYGSALFHFDGANWFVISKA